MPPLTPLQSHVSGILKDKDKGAAVAGEAPGPPAWYALCTVVVCCVCVGAYRVVSVCTTWADYP
jgi:hypothetical protein